MTNTAGLLFIITMTIVKTSTATCQCHGYHEHTSGDSAGYYYTDTKCDPETLLSKHNQNTTLCLDIADVTAAQINSFLETVLVDSHQRLCLRQLSIRDSDLADNITLTSFDVFQTLNFKNNTIRNLQQIVSGLSNLDHLDLSINTVSSVVEENTFSDLVNLKKLNLSSNSLKTIEPKSFANLNKLTNLDLSRNNQSTIQNNVFESLVALQILNLSHNHFEMLNEQCFRNLLELQKLDVSYNKLVQVSPAIHLPSLTSLILRGNAKLGISHEPYMLLVTGRLLQIVDASRTGLREIPPAYVHSIRILMLTGNSIKLIQRGDLDSYPLLQLLDLASNGLINIEYDALGRLNYLTHLYLNDNSLTEIPKSLPENLKHLYLDHNNIQRLSKKDFEGLHRLETLSISDNNIRHVDSNSFKDMWNLLALDLSRNTLDTLEEGCFMGPKTLKSLRLIGLKNNSLTIKGLERFFFLYEIYSVDLSSSLELAKVTLNNTSTLKLLANLREICLPDSNIGFIRPDLFHYLPLLKTLHFTGNNLSCSRTEWLETWMRRRNLTEKANFLCFNSTEQQEVNIIISLPTTEINSRENTLISNVTEAFEIPAKKNNSYNIETTFNSSNAPLYLNKYNSNYVESKKITTTDETEHHSSAKDNNIFSKRQKKINTSKMKPSDESSQRERDTSPEAHYLHAYAFSFEAETFVNTSERVPSARTDSFLKKEAKIQNDLLFMKTSFYSAVLLMFALLTWVVRNFISRRKVYADLNPQELQLFNPPPNLADYSLRW